MTMSKKDLKYCTILKTNINVTDMDKSVAYVTENLEELRGNYICVSNVHTTVMSYRNAEYRKMQNSGAMALPDGKPLSIVSRIRGFRDAERVPGPDFMLRIFRESERKGYRHYFYGSTEQTLQALKENLHREYPRLNIVGMYSPPFRELTPEEDAKAVAEINRTNPDFIWVALGAPKQEKWMNHHQFRVTGIMVGVGAAFDFSAGTVKRAPKWMQECCLEWLYRITQDPVRLIPRYFNTNFTFVWLTFIESLHFDNGNKKRRNRKPRNKKHRIAMIGHKRIPSREGGVEIVVDELSTRLVQHGFQVDAYNRSGYHVSGKEFDEKRGKVYNGIRLLTIPTFRDSKLNAIVYSFLATIRSLFSGYEIYHYHAEGPCAVLWLQKIFRHKVVATIHGLDWQRSKWGNFASYVLRFGERQAVKHADEIIVLSHNVQRYFKETYGRDTIYIPNGISRPCIRTADKITERWGLKKDGYILFLARLVPEKGAHYLIEAYRKLDTDKKLVIAGGNSHSAEYVSQIHQTAENNENIILTGFVQGQELEELYSNAWVFVLPSDIEGMALSLLEAMSFGNCCLVSDIRENTEVVEDKAVTFKKSDVSDLRKQLKNLLEHPETVAAYKAESGEYICRKYDWDKVTEQTIEVYQKLINK